MIHQSKFQRKILSLYSLNNRLALTLDANLRTLCIVSAGKGKAVPLQAWSDPNGSRKLRFPDFVKTAQDGGKVISPRNRPPLPPENTPGTHFC
jgi:hypothetical protein